VSSNRLAWLGPDDPPESFPDVELALREPDGLVAAGGDLSSERLLAAYKAGIFPWYEESQPILWWSPDPRCILRPDELHVSRRLAQEIKSSSLTLSFNQSFNEVVTACAGPRRSQQGTWITSEMAAAYERLHSSGWAHSVEVRRDADLVGGLYGLCIGRVFFGESMFSSVPNTSKMAMVALTQHMLENSLELIDCQVVSPHLMTLGARTIPRAEFTGILQRACEPANRHENWPKHTSMVAKLLTK
jgi:leucyl/phenylalanyl-tRNA--protein transferase